MTKPTLLFICTHNAGRSALGAALAREQAGDRAVVLSAGIDPAETASAGTIASLAEIGIDDSAYIPTKVTEELVRNATVVISMKPGLDVPQIEGISYETWDLPNPDGWDVEAIRPLRDHIDGRVADLGLNGSPAPTPGGLRLAHHLIARPHIRH
ncbi:low molecular weight phosphatase family protein [Ornithinimicrobium ciconiae]|uniref:Low molecular weight phosphatase family protein n=1 Tax=Ornithinimicrobium ciconiae TaxID=2594265 RepID=A0A516G9V3_9MICO|nr:low molecular weight phosphatase family protein [Ornithinimicrobium ciconiae]QDO88140.1 low molecular weight phosphatase family protein [Ornithinimicrobium ciconiae]